MERLARICIFLLVLMIFVIAGCEEVTSGLEGDVVSSITITSGGDGFFASGSSADSNPDSARYDFNELDWDCVDHNDFGSSYRELKFEESFRWSICEAWPGVEGQDGMTTVPSDLRLVHTRNDGTTQLADDRILLPEPADSVSLVTANFDRPLVNYITQRYYASWLVAYDSTGTEINRVLNDVGNRTGVRMVVSAALDTPIHVVGIETYPKSTYLDNLKIWYGDPDVTPPVLSYSVVHDTLSPADGEMWNVVSEIRADDDRKGPVTLTVSVASSESVVSPGDPTKPDWELVDNGDGSVDVFLRAEYAKSGSGRIYTVSLEAADRSENSAQSELKFVVPEKKK